MDDRVRRDVSGDSLSLSYLCQCQCEPQREWRKWNLDPMLSLRGSTGQQKYASAVPALPAPGLPFLRAASRSCPHSDVWIPPLEALRFTHPSLHSFLRKCESLLGGSELCQAQASQCLGTPAPAEPCGFSTNSLSCWECY